jgi:hypothetical protein
MYCHKTLEKSLCQTDFENVAKHTTFSTLTQALCRELFRAVQAHEEHRTRSAFSFRNVVHLIKKYLQKQKPQHFLT